MAKKKLYEALTPQINAAEKEARNARKKAEQIINPLKDTLEKDDRISEGQANIIAHLIKLVGEEAGHRFNGLSGPICEPSKDYVEVSIGEHKDSWVDGHMEANVARVLAKKALPNNPLTINQGMPGESGFHIVVDKKFEQAVKPATIEFLARSFVQKYKNEAGIANVKQLAPGSPSEHFREEKSVAYMIKHAQWFGIDRAIEGVEINPKIVDAAQRRAEELLSRKSDMARA